MARFSFVKTQNKKHNNKLHDRCCGLISELCRDFRDSGDAVRRRVQYSVEKQDVKPSDRGGGARVLEGG